MGLLIFILKVVGIIALIAAIEVLPSYLSAKKTRDNPSLLSDDQT